MAAGQGKTWGIWIVLLLAVLALVIVATPVFANAPEFIYVDETGLVTITDELCDFTVHVESDLLGTVRIYYDRDGNPTRIGLNLLEQDTFSANGKTLVGEPFHNVQVGLFAENGDLIYLYEVGVIERVPLPDGSVFLSAGRLDFIANQSNFILTPDVGRSGDMEAFCAALAP